MTVSTDPVFYIICDRYAKNGPTPDQHAMVRDFSYGFRSGNTVKHRQSTEKGWLIAWNRKFCLVHAADLKDYGEDIVS